MKCEARRFLFTCKESFLGTVEMPKRKSKQREADIKYAKEEDEVFAVALHRGEDWSFRGKVLYSQYQWRDYLTSWSGIYIATEYNRSHPNKYRHGANSLIGQICLSSEQICAGRRTTLRVGNRAGIRHGSQVDIVRFARELL